KKEAEGTNPATPATVDFGNTKVVAPNLETSITYRANSAEDADAKTVKLQKGLNFVSGDGTTATAEAAKAGITIAADKDGKVVFGLNEATRNAIDNAADKNLSNLSDAGTNKVKELAKTAAQESVKVASGNNVIVKAETKGDVTTYTVNGRDTTVKAADNGSISVTGGELNTKGEREYIVDLTADAKAELGKISNLNTRLGSAEGKITTLQSDMMNAKADIEVLKGNTATKDLDNISDKGKEVITGLIDVKGENGVTVTSAPDTKSKVKTFTVKIGDSATFGKGDKAVAIDGTTGTVTVGDKDKTNTAITPEGVTVTTKNADGTDKSKVEIKDGTISGLTNTDWDPTKVATAEDAKKDPTSAIAKERGKAATQGQIKDVVDKIVNGRGFEGDDNKKVSVALGDTLGIKGGATGSLTENNIGVVSTEAKDGKPATMTVKLAKDVNMKDGSTSYDNYVPEIKTNPDGSKEIVKNADGSVKYQTGKDGKPIHITTTVNAGGVTIAPNQGSGIPTVSLTADGLDNGGNQIHNVAAGTANTDAATVGQVRAAAHALNNRVNEAGAHAAALAAMNPLSYDPLKKSQVMAGVGSYKGNKALALGVAHYANEDTLFNVGVAVGDGSNMVNAGVTYRFGGEDSAVPERYKGGPISSVYVMQDEVSALKAENAEMKAQMKMLMERIEMLAAK
ncbi:YadA-like family protein, partial [Veillonella sp. DNF00869]|uniref:YadA-like family protein n=1 Tax=Veillonella sp. DNF00869 TaxID=1384081 RepID=UPI0007981B79